MGHPLASFPIISTRDCAEAEAVLSRELADLRFKRVQSGRAFRLDMNGVHLGQTMIGYNRYGTDTVVDPGLVEEAVVFSMGAGPSSVFEIDGDPVDCTQHGSVVSPSNRVLIHRAAASELFVLRAGIDALGARVGGVLGRRPGKPLVFNPTVDLARGIGAQVRQLVRSLIGLIEQDGAVLKNPLLRAGFDDLLLSALLELPNNYSNELRDGHPRSIAPWVVRQAEEFIHANAAEPITISDVVAQCGCSRSALFDAFRRDRGYTPMQFLADTRLTLAHEALQFPSAGDTVTSIAHACGFAHLGRFSETYLRRFGKNPSATLREGRAAGEL